MNNNNSSQHEKLVSVVPISVEKELKASFLDYAMSVIISRALPDVRDGLKPVHRRILYAMHNLGLYRDRPHRKSATVIGEVIGNYHPHGDSPIYQAMVVMAQDFAKRYPLLNGQGNWGSIDGDNAAAFRYTEVRMAEIARDILGDIEKGTVNFVSNFDETTVEPVVLPSRVPQLLINGSNGIAVGMATSIPPHNLTETVSAALALLHTPEISDQELFKIIPAPDFPLGGIIYGVSGVLKAYKTGYGSLKLRGTIEEEVSKKGNALIITTVPYQVNKAVLIEKIAELVKNKVIEGISDIRDESSGKGIRVVIELKRGCEPAVLINQLYRHTQLESSISMILLAIKDNRPVVFTLRELLHEFLDHRRQVVTRRAEFERSKALARKHILEGVIVAIENIDETVALIKGSADAEEAAQKLLIRFKLSDLQIKSILEMRLSKITSMETKKVEEEITVLLERITFFESILNDPEVLKSEISKELEAVKERYGDARRTAIDLSEDVISDIDLIPNDEMVVTLTEKGYVKRASIENYGVQHRGGRGKKGIADLDEYEDVIKDVVVGRNHDTLLFFTNLGRVYSARTFEIPEGSRIARGRAIINLLPLGASETIIKLLGVSQEDSNYLVMVTRKGVIKKTTAAAFAKIRSTGIIAIDLKDGDELAFCGLSSGTDNILLCTSNGYGIRFNEEEVRAMGRTAAGVRGITLRKNAQVVGMEIFAKEEDVQLLFATENGYGKQVRINDFRIAHRGGMGVRTIPVDARNGLVMGLIKIYDASNILLIDIAGKIIVLNPEEIRTMHRSAKGVRLVRLDEGRKLAKIFAFDVDKTEQDGSVEPVAEELLEETPENPAE